MQREPGRIIDGFIDLERGVNAGQASIRIARNAGAMAVNCTMRTGFVESRPAILRRILDFEDGGTEALFKTGNIQGAGFYHPLDGSEPLLFSSIGGHIFTTGARSYSTRELTSGDLNAAGLPRAWMEQAEQYFMIQNGSDNPFIWDGATLRRATATEVPVGTAMAYGQGRLAVARGREIFIGDILGGPTRVIDFTEIGIIALGGTYTVPFRGNITALRFVDILDSSTGQGELTAHTPQGVATYKLSAPRNTWKLIDFQKIGYRPFGSLSHDATLNINSDQWYRAHDGIRSLALGVSNDRTRWVNKPQSKELSPILSFDDRNLLSYAQAVLFDNRGLFSLSPGKLGLVVYHRGLGVIDFDPVSTLTEDRSPAWEGLWTGVRITKMITGEVDGTPRCWLFVLNSDNENELWEVSYDEPFDNDGTVRIQSSVEGASFFFENLRERKKLDSAEMFVDKLEGTVDFFIQYRPDQSPCWYDWEGWEVCATIKDCSLNEQECSVPHNLRPQYRARLWATTPPFACEAGQSKPAKEGFSFQPRISWTGKARIKQVFLHSIRTQEPPFGNNACATAPCEAVECCDPYLFNYSAELP